MRASDLYLMEKLKCKPNRNVKQTLIELLAHNLLNFTFVVHVLHLNARILMRNAPEINISMEHLKVILGNINEHR